MFPLFSPIDRIELALAIAIVVFALTWRRWLQGPLAAFAGKTVWCMIALAILPVGLRLLLLANHPIPTPNVADDFSYVLLADTLRHFRFANPPHALPQFFETLFVIQQPSYSSMFPLGQGMVLALGWILFGNPWAGVALSIGALCALTYWMLRAWTTPSWALVGGALAVMEFGPLNQWMNSFWGGAVSACAGCLVFGSLPRLNGRRYAVLLGIGLGVQLLTRPFEFVLLLIGVAAYFVLYGLPLRKAGIAGLALLPAIGLMLLQNRAVTGSWTTLPYMLSQYQYGIPSSFTFQPNPVPHLALTAEQQLAYQVQCSIHDDRVGYFGRLASRIRFYRFFFLPPLYLALPAFFFRLRERRFVWVFATVLLFSLGTNFYPYFFTHYIAAITCLFVLMSVAGLERISRRFQGIAELILFLCLAYFLFWYGLHFFTGQQWARAAIDYESWDAINYGDSNGRLAVNRDFLGRPGKHLVFVRYSARQGFDAWVYNGADVDASRVVWAWDLGDAEDAELRKYYPDRTAWLFQADYRPPRLTSLDRLY
ncbi:MAG: hypothetical protein ABSH09_13175 [Bryobacteraceae bacterium]